MNKVMIQRKFLWVERSALLCISELIRTTPNDALNSIFNLYPLDLVAKEVATISALRLRESREWHNNSIEHTFIIHNSSSLPKKTDCVPKLNFNKVDEYPRQKIGRGGRTE